MDVCRCTDGFLHFNLQTLEEGAVGNLRSRMKSGLEMRSLVWGGRVMLQLAASRDDNRA